jgi:hypothetical protein
MNIRRLFALLALGTIVLASGCCHDRWLCRRPLLRRNRAECAPCCSPCEPCGNTCGFAPHESTMPPMSPEYSGPPMAPEYSGPTLK